MRDARVERRDALARIDDEQDHGRRLDGETHLLFRRLRDPRRRVTAGQPEAARIEQRVAAVLDLGIDDVAGHAGHVVNDGDALAHQPVEQAAFPHIGATDDGDSARNGNHLRRPSGPRGALASATWRLAKSGAYPAYREPHAHCQPATAGRPVRSIQLRPAAICGDLQFNPPKAP